MRKQYIRFGEIPPNERSINFLKAYEEQNHCPDLENMNIDIYKNKDIISCLEEGVSVYNVFNGLPLINNFKLANSLLGRVKEKCVYLIEADEVGKGEDDEPLVRNIEIIKNLDFDEEVLNELVSKALDKYWPKKRDVQK